MAVYTVHEPPLKDGETAPDPDRFVFVRDGFYFWAFVLTPLWMLRHRLWLVFVCYLLITSAINVVLHVLNASTGVTVAVSVLVSLLAGIEGATLRRFTLGRRKFRTVGLVVGDDVESAERRFFDGWVHGEVHDLPPAPSAPVTAPPTPSAPMPLLHRPSAGPDVIGLFPQPGASR